MIAQRLLEGQTYVTISLVPYMIYKMRKDLTNAVSNELSSQHVVITGTRMLNKLNEIFGTGAPGTVAVDNFEEGARRHPKGIPILTLMASLLDPRMKAGIGIPDLDKGYIWQAIKNEAIHIGMQENQQAQQLAEINVDEDAENIAPLRPNPNQQLYDVMFDEINNNYLQEQAARQESVDRLVISVDAELLLYQQEPSLHLQDAQQKFNCPLLWWKNNQAKYRLLSAVALHLLCIPATSAPSERVFSVAGLTIAKDRARLAPQTANELIFLHDALPAIRNYEESVRAQ